MSLATDSELPRVAIDDITHEPSSWGPPSGDVFLNAASICALAAKDDPTYTANCLTHLRQAILHGCDKKLVDGNPLFSDFRESPAYQALSSLKPQPAAKLRQAEHLVGPF